MVGPEKDDCRLEIFALSKKQDLKVDAQQSVLSVPPKGFSLDFKGALYFDFGPTSEYVCSSVEIYAPDCEETTLLGC